MKKDGQSSLNFSQTRANDPSTKSPCDETSQKKSPSFTTLLAYSPETVVKPRSLSLLMDKLGFRRRRSSTENSTIETNDTTNQESADKLRQIQSTIDEQRQTIETRIDTAISQMSNDFNLVQFLLTEFSALAQKIIENRKSLDKIDREKLDIFVFQKQPPHLIYRYCELLFHHNELAEQNIKPLAFSDTSSPRQIPSSPRIFQRSSSGPGISPRTHSDPRISEQTPSEQIKLRWLELLIEKSSPDLIITLIYIANQLEIIHSENSHVLFRGETFSSKLSAYFLKAHAEKSLNNLVMDVIAYMRSLDNWPMDYNIDANSRLTKGNNKGKVLTSFSNLVRAISQKITSAECDPIIASIIALRFDLTFQSDKYGYNMELATKAAISLFWLRIFIPLFRTNTEAFTIEPIELPVFRRLTIVLTKASSDARFDDSDEDPTNKQLNKLIETHLLQDFRSHLNRIIENKSPPKIYDFKEKKWVVYRPLLSPTTNLGSNLDQLC